MVERLSRGHAFASVFERSQKKSLTVFMTNPCIDLQRYILSLGVHIMKTKEIETELVLQELESIRCKVNELSILVRSYAKAMLSREHDLALRMERVGVRYEV